jgi:hypothetical protein
MLRELLRLRANGKKARRARNGNEYEDEIIRFFFPFQEKCDILSLDPLPLLCFLSLSLSLYIKFHQSRAFPLDN